MKIKFDENGVAVFKEVDGESLPIFVADDGTEIEVNVPNLYNKITELNTEAKTYRQDKAALKEKYSLFSEVEDLEAWKTEAEKAIETVKNFDEEKLVKAGKVEEIKNQMRDVHEEEKGQIHESYKIKMGEDKEALLGKDATIYNLMVSSRFATSPFFTGSDPKTNLPADIAETYYGKQYKVEDDGKGRLRVTGYRLNGNAIYSRKNPGELAGFNESLEEIINESQHKDTILRTTGGGSGATGGDGGNRGLKGIDAKIAKAKELHAQAMEAKDGKSAVRYKNQIFTLEQQKRQGAT